MKARHVSLLLAVALFSLVLVSGSFAAEIELNLGHAASVSHHYHISSELFAKLVEEGTGGKVKINIFPANQLGSLPDMTESVRLGTQDMVLTADPIIGNIIPEFEALYLPYLFRDYAHVTAFDGSDAAKKLEDILQEHGMVLLGWWENGFRVITNNRKPIVTPADMAGMKLRIGESKMAVNTFTLLNVNPTPITMSELFTALQLGTVDGQENPTGRALSGKYYEVQKYLSLTRHQHVYEPLVMNKAKFDSLAPEIRAALLDAGKKVAEIDRKSVSETEAGEIEELKAKGMEINEVDLPAFQEAMRPLYDQYEKERGEKWAELVRMIQNL